jgi:hypothetical protein
MAPAVAANDGRRCEARTLVNWAVGSVRAQAPSLEVDGSAVVGDALVVLRDFSRIVDLVVVAQPTPGRLGHSIARLVAANATCPIVIVRTRNQAGCSGRPVVLLCDASAVSADAVGFAFEAAARRRTGLVLEFVDPTGGQLADSDALDGALSMWQRRYPDVAVAVESWQAGRRAVQAEYQRAELVVIGRTAMSHLNRTPAVIWSELRCPVAIVPEPNALNDRAAAPTILPARSDPVPSYLGRS